MSYFKLDINLSRNKITPELLKATSKFIASTLEEPEEHVVVHIHSNQLIVCGGSSDAAGHATLMSTGKLGIKKNKELAKVIFDYIYENLGILPARLYIEFIDSAPSAIGYNGTTFHPALGNE